MALFRSRGKGIIKAGKGATGATGPVASLTGDFVDNTDQANPIITLRFKKKSLNAAQIKTLNSIPIEAIPAPGAGKAIQVYDVSARFNWNSVQFDFGDEVGLIIDTLTYGQRYVQNLLSSTSNAFINGVKELPGMGNYSSLKENKALMLVSDMDSGTGDSTVDFYIFYYIINL